MCEYSAIALLGVPFFDLSSRSVSVTIIAARNAATVSATKLLTDLGGINPDEANVIRRIEGIVVVRWSVVLSVPVLITAGPVLDGVATVAAADNLANFNPRPQPLTG